MNEPSKEQSPGVEGPAELDDIDRQLIRLLRVDGRTSNKELARLTGVSAVTVANRVRRLVCDDVIRIQAVANSARLGYPVEVIIGIHADVRRVREAAAALCELTEVRYVSITSGTFDIIIAALLRSEAHLLNFLMDELPSINGIEKLETSHALHVLKRNPDWISFADLEVEI